MRFLRPVPPFAGLETIHYVGAGFSFFGAVLWIWVVALSRREWAVVQSPLSFIAAVAAKSWQLCQNVISKRSHAAPQHQRRDVGRPLKPVRNPCWLARQIRRRPTEAANQQKQTAGKTALIFLAVAVPTAANTVECPPQGLVRAIKTSIAGTC